MRRDRDFSPGCPATISKTAGAKEGGQITIETTELAIAPGSVVIVRDEEWLVTQIEPASDGQFLHVQGLSELVRETEAIFSTAIDDVVALDPSRAKVVADDSPEFRRARLWLESTLRKSAVPLTEPSLTVAPRGLLDVLDYQLTAVKKALAPEKLRPRILLADAVGLGKTAEIGMILSELVRRGRGERILIVTPKHVLEQTQFEMWTRFALPFVRLDSVGIQRIRQKLPANRNPFAFYKRVIVSIDTLKSDRYLAHLEKQHWDAVVIDESHNVTNSTAQNNRLARLVARRSDALILASATPHNGRKESFAELIRLLEPSAVTPEGELVEELVKDLIIRRHRHSPEVAAVVGADWAERKEPNNILVAATGLENEIAHELNDVWLHPQAGKSPYSGNNAALFPWTLAKAFLSSPAALHESVKHRLSRTSDATEIDALQRLKDLAAQAIDGKSAKYDALVKLLQEIRVSRRSPERAVIFAERVPTLHWLAKRLEKSFGLPTNAVAILHGQLSDERQQEIVESFKQESSPIRLLVTGDVASEGVNLHLQCHELIHFDVPWSLIRIEQRNGRVDRYGQKHRPRITTLLLDPQGTEFAGDIRVLQRLMEREHEAHQALGDVSSLMGKYDTDAEEDAIRRVLARQQSFEDVVSDVEEVTHSNSFGGFFERIVAASNAQKASPPKFEGHGVFPNDVTFLRDALSEVFKTPHLPPGNGVSWKDHAQHQLAELEPPRDLVARLGVLPQSYLAERRVTDKLLLATTTQRGKQDLDSARSATSKSLWPESHFLAPLHPVLEWISDRALASLSRNAVFAVRGEDDTTQLLVHGSLTNRRGQVVAAAFIVVTFPDASNPALHLSTVADGIGHALDLLRIRPTNTGAVQHADRFEALIPSAIHAANGVVEQLVTAARDETVARVESWKQRASAWEDEADALVQRSALRDRRAEVAKEQELADALLPQQILIRPLLVVAGGDD